MTREGTRASRVALEVPASVCVGSERLPCRLLNVSTTGIALASGSQRSLGTWVRISFELPGQLGATDADAVVVRNGERGSEVEWGLQFLNLRPEARAQLREFVGCAPPIHPAPETAGPQRRAPSEEVAHRLSAGEHERLQKLALRKLYRDALDQLDS